MNIPIGFNGGRKTNYEVPTVRELTAESFIKVIIDKNVFKLDEYLSLFTDLSIDQINNSEVKTSSIPVLYSMIYDADIKKIMSTKPNRFTHNDKSIAISHVELNTFGARFYVDKKKMTVQNTDQKSYYEFCVYTLACGLSDSVDPVKYEKIYEELMRRPWVEVMPAAFFLGRKFLKTNLVGRLQSLNCIWGYRAMSSMIRRYLKYLKRQEKKELRRYYVK